MLCRDREFFDKQVEWVLKRLPEKVTRLLEEVPLCVEDKPSAKFLREMDFDDPEGVCGCFVGRSIDKKSYGAIHPDQIVIYRLGIYDLATDESGYVDRKELREQIRITIIHELGHYHGMNEDEVREWGYG